MILIWQISFQGKTKFSFKINKNHLFENPPRTTLKVNYGCLFYNSRYFRYLCIASKIDACVSLAKKALAVGKSVVIGLQSTGEAQAMKNEDNKNDDEIGSTCHGVLIDLLKSVTTTGSLPFWGGDDYDEDDDDEDDYASSDNDDMYRREVGGKQSKSRKMREGDCFFIETEDNLDTECSMKEILNEIKSLKSLLPANALDQLINKLGGPDKVISLALSF